MTDYHTVCYRCKKMFFWEYSFYNSEKHSNYKEINLCYNCEMNSNFEQYRYRIQA